MNRAVSGTVTVQGTGQPLTGLRLVVARLVDQQLEILGAGVSEDFGRFRIAYDPLYEPADLTVLVLSEEGRILFREPVHRMISGAELLISMEVPRVSLGGHLH